jgi:hypothetical protein
MTMQAGRRVRCLVRAGLLAASLAAPGAALADPVSILFVGNSYTFGRADPVLSYNSANVRDLTAPSQPGFSNTNGSNAFEPHPWGGVAGIFKQFTVQAGLNYDVALSTRNAATLRGHYLQTNPAGWPLRGNVALQQWDKMVLQERSDDPLPLGTTPNASPAAFNMYARLLAEYARTVQPAVPPPIATPDTRPLAERVLYGGFTETELFGSTAACRAATGASANTCNSTIRTVTANPNANPNTEVYLYQTWARPNLIEGGFVTQTDDTTGAVTRTTTPITGPYAAADGLEAMTEDLREAFLALFMSRPDLFTGIAPVGDAFLRAVQQGRATRNMYAPDALTDGLIDLWFDDGTHASKWGSYLSALTIYGTVTGRDPRFGRGEQAAADLGISEREAIILQQIAAESLGLTVPEPATGALFLLGVAALGALRRRARR